MMILYIIAAFILGVVFAKLLGFGSKQKNVESLKSKVDFLANISHEIRTPMSGIMGLTQVLAETSLDDKQREYVSTIQQSCESLLSIVNDVLDFAKIEAGKMKLERVAFSPEAIVWESLALFKVKADEKKLKLESSVKGDVPKSVMGDPHRIREILLNLLSNAIKFTDKGFVSIEWGYVPDHEGGLLSFAIKDSGLGIAEESITYLFKEYSQLESVRKCPEVGAGLGLLISKKLAHLMGGDLVVESALGRGSTFTLIVQADPASPDEESEVSASLDEAAVDVERLKKLNVLIVEDNPINLKVMVIVLERLGIKPAIAASGKEAVRMSMSNHYDAIFMDVIMPEMGGLEAVTAIRHMQHREFQPYIIAMTAAAEDKAVCIDVGMNAYIAKPFTIDVVKQALVKATLV